LTESFEAAEPFLDLPPRELVLFIDVGGGSEGLSGVDDMDGNLSSVAVDGVVGTSSVLLSSGTPSVEMAGFCKLPSVLLRTDLLLRPPLVGAGCSAGSNPISSSSAIPCGRSLQSPRNCNKKSRSYLSTLLELAQHPLNG
jgi:hypothetical protein